MSVNVTGRLDMGLNDTENWATGAAGADAGSAVISTANGSPEPLLMTDAKARTGWSLVNSIQRFVSVEPATPGNVPLSSIAFSDAARAAAR